MCQPGRLGFISMLVSPRGRILQAWIREKGGEISLLPICEPTHRSPQQGRGRGVGSHAAGTSSAGSPFPGLAWECEERKSVPKVPALPWMSGLHLYPLPLSSPAPAGNRCAVLVSTPWHCRCGILVWLSSSEKQKCCGQW